MPGEDAPKEYVDVLSRGFEVGRSVTLTKRCTGFVVDAKDDDVSQKDVNPGLTDVPVGSTSRVTITFLTDLQVKGKAKRKSVEVALKAHVNDVQLVVAKAAPAKGTPKKEAKKTLGAGSADATHRKYPSLQQGRQDAPDIFEEWDARQTLHGKCATDGEMPEAKAKAVLAMLAMNSAKPLTSTDILIARRGKKIELWSLVAWKAGELVLTSCTAEIKNRYWTLSRSALPKHPLQQDTHLALDGRLAGKIPSADHRPEFLAVLGRGEDTEKVKSKPGARVREGVDVKPEMPREEEGRDGAARGACDGNPVLGQRESHRAEDNTCGL